MLEYLTLGEFVVALLMGLAALCAFIWGAATGAFRGGERIKYQVLRVEGIARTEGTSDERQDDRPSPALR
jgi:cbb3-type cytochrome oxidase maturation protein